MLHTNFQGHRPFGSGEEDVLRFLSYMGVAAFLVMWPGPFEQNFVPPSHGGSIWNLTLIGQAVSEEKMFKKCGRRRTTDDRRRTTTDDGRQRPTYTISSPNEPKGSGELIRVKLWFFSVHRVMKPVVVAKILFALHGILAPPTGFHHTMNAEKSNFNSKVTYSCVGPREHHAQCKQSQQRTSYHAKQWQRCLQHT